MPRIDEATRLIEAQPDAIYAAMTESEALCAWLPPPGMSAKMLQFDPRPGGGYRMSLRYENENVAGKSGGNEDIVEVRYRDLVPNQLVSQEVDFVSDDPHFSGTMRMDWSIEDRGEGTEVTIRARDVPESIDAADHREGLSASLANLARFVEKPIP